MTIAAVRGSFGRYFVVVLLLCDSCVIADEKTKVGIVGAGIGGTSAAYFLRELFNDDVEIDIFEKQHVGGRLAPITISGFNYNAGGSIIHPANLYMSNFTEILGLGKDLNPEPGRLGIFNGEEMVFSTSDYTAISLGKLLWRYGMDIYNIKGWVQENILKHVGRMYELQKSGHAYSTVEDLLNAMDPKLVDFTKKSVKTLLKEEGFGDKFIDEFVMAAMRINYGQTTDIHGLVGSVSMAGVEPGLWNVVGGNHKVPQGLLSKSGANLIRAEVNTISLASDESPPLYQIDYTPVRTQDIRSKEYDIVIIASPLYQTLSSINFEDFQSDIKGVDYPFHTTIATFMEGKPNAGHFGYSTPEELPNAILTCNDSLYFSSFSKQKPVTSEQTQKPVYRIFSNKVPTKDQLEQLVPEYSDLRMVDWKAYPHYPSSIDLPSFSLHEQMYHIGAIETAASAMEMSAIAAKNVALLAYYRKTGQYDKIDEIGAKIDEHGKTEL